MKCSSVSKQFKKLANDDLLWKGIISRGLPNLFPNLKIRVIDKEVWEKYVDREKWGIRFDGKAASNKQIVKELQAFSKLPIEGDAGITLLNLSDMTTPVTFNKFSEIAKSLELDGVKFFADSIRNDVKEHIGNEHIDINRTILLTNSILEESRNKTYYDQKQLVEEDNGCELPETPLILVSTVFAYLMDKERLFPREPYLTYTRCSNAVEVLPGYPAAHIIVGNFISNGFNIGYDFSASTDFFGAAAMRKF